MYFSQDPSSLPTSLFLSLRKLHSSRALFGPLFLFPHLEGDRPTAAAIQRNPLCTCVQLRTYERLSSCKERCTVTGMMHYYFPSFDEKESTLSALICVCSCSDSISRSGEPEWNILSSISRRAMKSVRQLQPLHRGASHRLHPERQPRPEWRCWQLDTSSSIPSRARQTRPALPAQGHLQHLLSFSVLFYIKIAKKKKKKGKLRTRT